MLKTESNKKLKKDLVNIYYHKNCSDGFGAAWAAHKYFGNSAKYIPVSHDHDFVFERDSINYFLDFSPKEKYISELEEKSKKLFIIDHHISSYDYLKEKPYYFFNVKNSGCVLAWKHFFPKQEVPVILKYIEDRDLWSNSLYKTNEVFLYINLYSHNYLEWDKCNDNLTNRLEDCIKDGENLYKYRDELVSAVSKNCHNLKIGGIKVKCINSPLFQSYMLSKMYNGEKFMAAYYFDGEKYIFSLRSSKDSNLNVSDIAKIYDGGGHKNASGFSIKRMWMLSVIYYKYTIIKSIKSILRPIKRCVQYLYRKLF